MRLLFLTNLFPPFDLGGYEQWAQEVAETLQARGHTLHVMTSRYRLAEGRPPEDDRLDVRRELYLQTGIDYYRPMHFFARRPSEERRNIRHVARAVREIRPDRVLVWGMWNLSLNTAAAAEASLPGKVAYYISSYWPEDLDPHRAYWNAPEKKTLARLLKMPAAAAAQAVLDQEGYPPPLQFQHVRCCSRYVRDRLVGAGALPDHSGVLYGGIDPAPFSQVPRVPVEGKLNLLYFGSLIPQKGVQTALQALELLRDAGLGDSLRLTVLGSGHPEYERRLRSYVDQKALAGLVQFVPRIPQAEIPDYLQAHDIFLFTSVWPEPMARTVMEAMASGMLVIGTEVGGQVEMLAHDRNALTFPPENARALADRIRLALEWPDRCRMLAEAGRRSVLQDYTLVRMAEDMEVWLEGISD